MVLRFNFSVISVSNKIDKIEASFNNICRTVIGTFISYYKSYLKEIDLNNTIPDILYNIFNQIKEKNLPPVYIIIDEYDNFTNQLIQSHSDGLYGELTTENSFLRTFFKAIKAGTEDNSVRRCYITGVLPITIDDLTSGFNIAEIITLNDQFTNMLGFTQDEIETYLKAIFESYKFDKNNLEVIKVILRKYYNGWLFRVYCGNKS